MNYLDIILWASAVGLWVWVLVTIIDWFLERSRAKDMIEDTQFNRIAALEKEHLNIELDLRCNVMKRLDAIEAKLKKGKR